MFLMSFCFSIIIAQDNTTTESTVQIASEKDKFEIGLEMLKDYRADLQDRLEKSTALLIVVIGWLITSETARKSINKKPLLFWGGVVVLTVLMIAYCLTIYNFVGHFRKIQTSVESLGYVEKAYLVRYQMPDKIFYTPAEFSYIVPVLAFYVFILLILLQIKYDFIDLEEKTNTKKAKINTKK